MRLSPKPPYPILFYSPATMYGLMDRGDLLDIDGITSAISKDVESLEEI